MHTQREVAPLSNHICACVTAPAGILVAHPGTQPADLLSLTHCRRIEKAGCSSSVACRSWAAGRRAPNQHCTLKSRLTATFLPRSKFILLWSCGDKDSAAQFSTHRTWKKKQRPFKEVQASFPIFSFNYHPFII